MSRQENRAGLYLTVIFHLTVIIVLLLYSIDTTLRREESFVRDFSKQEEIEKREEEEVMKKDISQKLEEMIGEFLRVDYMCALERLCPDIEGKVNMPLLPVELFLTYEWDVQYL